MMYASAYRCDTSAAATVAPARLPAFIRSASEVRAEFAVGPDATTAVSALYEAGSVRLRFPNSTGRCEGVLVNTGGGMAGGDAIALSARLAPAAAVTLTTQSAEKIYRTEGAPSRIGVRIELAARSSLFWLPQETILFDGARLERGLAVDLAADATLTLLEITVFGRIARGERIGAATLQDSWRIHRAGRLVLAEEVRSAGPLCDLLDQPAIGKGARAVATLVHVAPDAERKLMRVRAAQRRAASECAASAWNKLLVARFLAADPFQVRQDAIRAARALTRLPMPRVWSV